VATGFLELDRLLPWGGWPATGLSELLLRRDGQGELQLLLPVLARLSCDGRWLAWVDPPHLPYAPALAAAGLDLSRLMIVHPPGIAESIWAAEQALRAGVCGAVLLWADRLDFPSLRRLQLAAEEGGCGGFLFRPRVWARQSSPAMLRLAVEQREQDLRVELLKLRGGSPCAVDIPLSTPRG
jgi:hypothetical protein